MPLAATHRNFKRNASSATGARHNSVHASQRGRGGVGHAAVRKCIIGHSGLGPPSVVLLKIAGNQNNDAIIQKS
jgi:hypothetical protein